MYVNDLFVINENSRSKRHFPLVQPQFKTRIYGFSSIIYQASHFRNLYNCFKDPTALRKCKPQCGCTDGDTFIIIFFSLFICSSSQLPACLCYVNLLDYTNTWDCNRLQVKATMPGPRLYRACNVMMPIVHVPIDSARRKNTCALREVCFWKVWSLNILSDLCMYHNHI